MTTRTTLTIDAETGTRLRVLAAKLTLHTGHRVTQSSVVAWIALLASEMPVDRLADALPRNDASEDRGE